MKSTNLVSQKLKNGTGAMARLCVTGTFIGMKSIIWSSCVGMYVFFGGVACSIRFRDGADVSRNSSWAAFLTKREVQALLSADTEEFFEMQPETMAFFQALRNCRNSRTESRNEEEDEVC